MPASSLRLARKTLIVLLAFLPFFGARASYSQTSQNSEATPTSSSELSRRVEVAMRARESGDLEAIGQASGQVIALALADLARLRLDQRAYGESIALCRESLEFEDVPDARIELAIADLYAKKASDAAEQASIATEKDPASPLSWMIKGEALLQVKDYAGAAMALAKSLERKQDAEPQYALGLAYLGLGEKQKAADSFSQFLALTGDHGWSRVLIGRAYLEQKLSHEAEREFRQALQLDPGTPSAHHYWALALLQANDWNPDPEARSQLQEELKLNPRHLLANYLLGYFASIERNYDESNRYLRSATEISPSLPEAWMFLGINAQGRNSNHLAETYLRKAILLADKGSPTEHPSIRKAYFVLGRILLSSGRKKEGEELLQKTRALQRESFTDNQLKLAAMQVERAVSVTEAVASQISGADSNLTSGGQNQNQAVSGKNKSGSTSSKSTGPPQPVAARMEHHLYAVLGSSFNDLATAEALQEKYVLAYKHYREAARWDSQIPGLQRNLGLAAFFVDEHAEAIRLLSAAVAAAPEDAHARATLGLAYFATKRYGKAVQTIAPIADRAAQDPQLGLAWAKSLAETGNKKAAAQALTSLEKSGGITSTATRIQDGQLWGQLGNWNLAEKYLRQAVTLDPANDDAEFFLAVALVHLAKPQEATDLFLSVLERQPDNTEARFELAKTLLATGKPSEAIPHLEQVVRVQPGKPSVHFALETAYRKIGRLEDAEREHSLAKALDDPGKR